MKRVITIFLFSILLISSVNASEPFIDMLLEVAPGQQITVGQPVRIDLKLDYDNTKYNIDAPLMLAIIGAESIITWNTNEIEFSHLDRSNEDYAWMQSFISPNFPPSGGMIRYDGFARLLDTPIPDLPGCTDTLLLSEECLQSIQTAYELNKRNKLYVGGDFTVVSFWFIPKVTGPITINLPTLFSTSIGTLKPSVGDYVNPGLNIIGTVNGVTLNGEGGTTSGGGGSTSGLLGDCNGDCKVDIFDFAIVRSGLRDLTNTCDTDGNGETNIFDLAIVRSGLKEVRICETSTDGTSDGGDTGGGIIENEERSIILQEGSIVTTVIADRSFTASIASVSASTAVIQVNNEFTNVLENLETQLLSDGSTLRIEQIQWVDSSTPAIVLISLSVPLAATVDPNINDPQVICTDSDGGENYEVKGSITGTHRDGPLAPREDFCQGNSLYELSCNNNLAVPQLYECPNGCDGGGACIPMDSAPTNIGDSGDGGGSDSLIDMNLRKNPASSGDQIWVDLMLNTDFNGGLRFGGIYSFITWNPDQLQYVGFSESGNDYKWVDPVVRQVVDGGIHFRAFSNFGNPPRASTNFQVVTFKFNLKQGVSGEVPINILRGSGDSKSLIVDFVNPGLDIAGDLTGISIFVPSSATAGVSAASSIEVISSSEAVQVALEEFDEEEIENIRIINVVLIDDKEPKYLVEYSRERRVFFIQCKYVEEVDALIGGTSVIIKEPGFFSKLLSCGF